MSDIPCQPQPPAQNPPVILIPGSAGSRMTSTLRGGNSTEVSWIAAQIVPRIQAGRIIAERFWGFNDTATGLFKSFVSDYIDVVPIKGLSGCSRLLESKVLEPILVRFKIGFYFHNIIRVLVTRYGYTEDSSISAFCYDWRQDLSHSSIMDGLRRHIKDTRARHGGQKVCVVTHSMGGTLFRTYQQAYPDWHEDILRNCSIATPFDGAGAYTLSSFITGYNLRLPVSYCCALGIQAAAAANVYMNVLPGSTVNPFITPALFVKRYDDQAPVSRVDSTADVHRMHSKSDPSPMIIETIEEEGEKGRGANTEKLPAKILTTPPEDEPDPLRADPLQADNGAERSDRDREPSACVSEASTRTDSVYKRVSESLDTSMLRTPEVVGDLVHGYARGYANIGHSRFQRGFQRLTLRRHYEKPVGHTHELFFIKLKHRFYRNRMPNLTFCILEHIKRNPALLTVDIEKGLQMLVYACKPKSVTVYFDGKKIKKRSEKPRNGADLVFEPDYTHPANLASFYELENRAILHARTIRTMLHRESFRHTRHHRRSTETHTDLSMNDAEPSPHSSARRAAKHILKRTPLPARGYMTEPPRSAAASIAASASTVPASLGVAGAGAAYNDLHTKSQEVITPVASLTTFQHIERLEHPEGLEHVHTAPDFSDAGEGPGNGPPTAQSTRAGTPVRDQQGALAQPLEIHKWHWEKYTIWAKNDNPSTVIVPDEFVRTTNPRSNHHLAYDCQGHATVKPDSPFHEFFQGGGFNASEHHWTSLPHMKDLVFIDTLLQESQQKTEELPDIIRHMGHPVMAKGFISNYGEINNTQWLKAALKNAPHDPAGEHAQGKAEDECVCSPEMRCFRDFIEHPHETPGLDEYMHSRAFEDHTVIEDEHGGVPDSSSDESGESADYRLDTGIQAYVDPVAPTRRAIKLPPGPWLSCACNINIKNTCLAELIDQVTLKGTVERILFGPYFPMWDRVMRFRAKPVTYPVFNPSDRTQYRFLNIVGYNSATPLHAVYPKPVDNYEEIRHQLPTFLNVNGDSTVCLYSAINDEVPDEFVNDRVMISGISHFLLLHQERVANLIASFFELQEVQ